MLPQGQRHPVPSWKVSIGEWAGTHPAKDDKFTVRERTKLGRGTKTETRWVVHTGMMERLYAACERAGIPVIEIPNRDPEKPPTRKVLSVPVMTPHNTVGEAVFSEMAMWASGRYVCHCGQFGVKTDAIARDQGLPTPVPPPEKAGRAFFIGTAERFFWTGNPQEQTFHCDHTQKLTCDPATCPFATGRWDKPARTLYHEVFGKWPTEKQIGKKRDRKLCSPNVIVPLILPWVDTESPRAVFVNHAWGSGGALQRTYEEIRRATGGIVAGIPLRLDLLFKEAITPGGRQEIPVVQFGTLVPWSNLRALGEEVGGQLASTGRLAGQVQQQLLALSGVVEEHTTDPDVVAALQREFDDGVQEEAPFANAAEARFRDLAERCKWSPVAVNKFLDDCDEREVYDQITSFEEELGIADAAVANPAVPLEVLAEETEVVVDAEFEAEVAEEQVANAAPEGIAKGSVDDPFPDDEEEPADV